MFKEGSAFEMPLIVQVEPEPTAHFMNTAHHT